MSETESEQSAVSDPSVRVEGDVMRSTKPRCLGPSSDHRTNAWEVECPKCGRKFKPYTTRFAHQGLDCPRSKCGAQMLADYNNEVVRLVCA